MSNLIEQFQRITEGISNGWLPLWFAFVVFTGLVIIGVIIKVLPLVAGAFIMLVSGYAMRATRMVYSKPKFGLGWIFHFSWMVTIPGVWLTYLVLYLGETTALLLGIGFGTAIFFLVATVGHFLGIEKEIKK